MARIINRDLAEKIATKLEATFEESRSHLIAKVHVDGVLVCWFGIRRGSSKESGHDHVPAQIHIGPSKARLLGQCPMSRKEWVLALKEKRLI
jgi:hypothetical protein